MEITEAEFKKRVKAKKKELFKKRVIFVACCFMLIALLVGIVFGVSGIIKLFKNVSREKYYDTTSTDVNSGDNTTGVYYTGELIYAIAGDSVNCMLPGGSVLWEKELSGEGEIKSLCLGNYLLAYRFGGSELAFYCKEGELFTKTQDGSIDFATVNETAKKCAVCARKTDGTSVVYVFGYKEVTEEGEEPIELLLEKTYKTTLIVSAAISENGKTLAIGELSESGSTSATKLSLAHIETGKTYFTKIFEKEVLPYLCFDKENIIIAGGKHVYVVETTKSSAKGQTINTLCSLDSNDDSILSVAVSAGYVAVVIENAAGNSKMSIYSISELTAKSVSTTENPLGVISCGELFGMYTSYDIKLVNNDGKVLGNSEKFATISEVLGTNTLSVTVKDAVGYTIVRFEK